MYLHSHYRSPRRRRESERERTQENIWRNNSWKLTLHGKESACNAETWVRSLGWEDPLEEEMATHSSILAWRIPWTEEPGGLQSMGSQRVRHDWANTHSLTRDLGDNIKCTNIPIIGVAEGEKREKGPEKIFEDIIAENFFNMGKERVNQVQEPQRVPGRINLRRNTPRHIVIKLTNIKDKTLKTTREKWQIT